MKKKELRKIFFEKRKGISLAEIHFLSSEIFEKFFCFFSLEGIKYIHTFFPIQNKAEINTWLFHKKILKAYPEIRLVTSRSDLSTGFMESVVIDEGTNFEINEWGIPEPKEGFVIDEKELDMVLLPLLTFDKSGNRVGYGKGFYDRFLSNCRSDVKKVGLSLFEAIDEIEDTNEFDIPLNFCVTPEKIIVF